MSKKVIAIIGPTGMGKTNLALELFKQYHLPIISVDAFQLYIEMNIGVNKPKPSEQTATIHMYNPCHSGESNNRAKVKNGHKKNISTISHPFIAYLNLAFTKNL